MLRVSGSKRKLANRLLGLDEQPRRQFCHKIEHGVPPVSPTTYKIEMEPRNVMEDEGNKKDDGDM